MMINCWKHSHLLSPVIALVLVCIGGCASSQKSPENQAAQRELQSQAIQRWSDCLDTELEQRFATDPTARKAIEAALDMCQGYRTDVLAVYPRKLEKPLDRKLKEQAYERAISKFAQTGYRTLAEKAAKN